LYTKIIAVCSQFHTKHITYFTLWAECGSWGCQTRCTDCTSSSQWDLRGLMDNWTLHTHRLPAWMFLQIYFQYKWKVSSVFLHFDTENPTARLLTWSPNFFGRHRLAPTHTFPTPDTHWISIRIISYQLFGMNRMVVHSLSKKHVFEVLRTKIGFPLCFTRYCPQRISGTALTLKALN
jgi:hypothetical protein